MTKEILHYDNMKSFIEKLSEIAQTTDLAEIEFKENNVHIKITRNKAYTAPVLNHVTMQDANVELPKTTTLYKNHEVVSPALPSKPENDANHDGALKSPMVGVIYTAANPESNNFVSVGSQVKKGDTVLLIEAMKVFNPIKAHKDGTVSKILVQGNEAVEFDQVLLIIE